MGRTEGIINLLKPAGMTSHDAVSFLRRLTGEKKIGHTGTLDPLAVGVLPLCIGNATRIIEYLDKDEKDYRCEMLLGMETDTLDIWGQVLRDRRRERALPTFEELDKMLRSFEGDGFQAPPQYSAIKIQGKPMYRYARSGQEVELNPRPVRIGVCRLVSFDSVTGRALFDVTCSRGTYIRSICRDLGEKLNCGATMSFLVRTRSGLFDLETAVTLEELRTNWRQYVLPMDHPLGRFGILVIPEGRRKWFRNGGYLRPDDVEVRQRPEALDAQREVKKDGYKVYCAGDFMGVTFYNEEKELYLADKVFDR